MLFRTFLLSTLFLALVLFSFLVTRITLSTVAFGAEVNKEQVKWTCPMHPHYIADDSGSCPICGMDLVKLKTGSKNTNKGTAIKRESLNIASETLQKMGVRLAKAEKSSFGRIIRSYGLVAENERLQFDLTARTEGWIEKLRVRAIGDHVKKGDLLFSLYAPEFSVSQRDYLNAVKGTNRTLITSTETRLKAFGMQDRAIEQIKKNRKTFNYVPFYAERNGTITHIELRPGSYVKRGMLLTRVQDFSQVWLMVSVSEKDLTFVKPGTKARITFPNIPGREIFAKIEYVYPTVDQATRTGKVRLVLDNKDGQLRPGAYADVAFEVETEERLAVPTEAILMSGSGRYIIASLGGGRFEPRSVKIGLTSGRWTEVSGEIKDGDDIVVSGQFLIDSESALRESFRKLEKLQLPFALIKLDTQQFAMFDHFVDAALYLHEALIKGHDIEPKFLDPAIEVKTLLWPAFQNTQLAFVMEDAVKALEQAKEAQTTSEKRNTLLKLVKVLEPWMRDGAPQHYREKKVVMFEEVASGQRWLQMSADPFNPYSKNPAKKISWPDTPAKQETIKSTNMDKMDDKAKPMTGHQHH